MNISPEVDVVTMDTYRKHPGFNINLSTIEQSNRKVLTKAQVQLLVSSTKSKVYLKSDIEKGKLMAKIVEDGKIDLDFLPKRESDLYKSWANFDFNTLIPVEIEKSEDHIFDAFIQLDYEDLYKSEGVKTLEGEDVVEKSELFYALNRSGMNGLKDPIVFKKKGKEIVEKITSKVAILETECNQCKTMIVSLKEKIGFEPKGTFPKWRIPEGLKIDPGVMNFKPYTYDQCKEAAVEQPSNDTVTSDSEVVKEKTNEVCRHYNSLIDKCLSLCIDIQVLEFWKRNIDEKTTFQLSPQQAMLLGF